MTKYKFEPKDLRAYKAWRKKNCDNCINYTNEFVDDNCVIEEEINDWYTHNKSLGLKPADKNLAAAFRGPRCVDFYCDVV